MGEKVKNNVIDKIFSSKATVINGSPVQGSEEKIEEREQNGSEERSCFWVE